MKKILFTLAIALNGYCSYAQFSTSTGDATTLYNVGIGTTSPSPADASAKTLQIGNNLILQNVVGNQSLFSNNAYYDNTGWKYATSDWASGIRMNNDHNSERGISFVIAPSGTSGNAITNWDGNAVKMYIGGSGNVGIGTTSPTAKLHIENGNVLVNTDILAGLGGQITISNNYGNQNGSVRLNLNNGGAVSWIKGVVTGPNTNTGSAMAFGVPSNTADGSEAMRITSDGNLAINTIDAHGYKLAVNGNAIATSMTVKLYANWPDYVFKKDYKLPSLTAVKTYIGKNQHLPDMPSEAEVAKNGINLGEIVKLQTKKIEELTLYLIEQQKQITEQNNKLAEQQSRINQLAKRGN